MNMENVARCLNIDEDTYAGALRVKVGPVALTFQGTVHVETRNREQ